MISAKRFTSRGDENGTTDLPERIFGERVNEHVLWLSVRTYLINQRQGTSAVKNRRLVSGGGRKPWRQKGTGRARAGSSRSPIWVGGARAFGPRPRTYDLRLPRRVRQLGLRCAYSLAAKEDRVLVVGDLQFEKPRTKEMAGLLSRLGSTGRKCLMVTATADPNVYLSGRNVPNLRVTSLEEVNPYLLLDCEQLILTESALGRLREVTQR